jgi:hypothetical protein
MLILKGKAAVGPPTGVPEVDWGHPLSNGLVWCWVPVVADFVNLTGLTLDGVAGTPTPEPDGDQGVLFTGWSFLVIPSSAALDAVTGYTVVFHVSASSWLGGYNCLFGRRSYGAYNTVNINAGGRVSIYHDWLSADPAGTFAMSLNQSYQFVYFDGAAAGGGYTTGYYVNGALEYQTSPPAFSRATQGDVSICGDIGYGRLWHGHVATVHRIYGRVLAASEVLALYQNPWAGLITA